jgi:hypothetical protein
MYEDLDAKEIRKVHFDMALNGRGKANIGVEQLAVFKAFNLHSGIKNL